MDCHNISIGLLSAYLYELLENEKGCFQSIFLVTNHTHRILSTTTIIILTKEGVDIMLRRLRQQLKKEAIIEAQAIAKGKAEAEAEAKIKLENLQSEWEHWAENGRDPQKKPKLPNDL